MSEYRDLEKQCCGKEGKGKGHEARCMMSTEQKQIGGDHYRSMGIQPKDFCDANMTTDEYLAALRWNVQKYTWRKKDNTIEDFKKAIHYLEMGIERLEKDKADAIKRGEFF